MVFIKGADFKKAIEIFRTGMPPRKFMLSMEEEYGFAYWISGVLYWLVDRQTDKADLLRFFMVQRKIRSVGYAIHEDIPSQWDIIKGQIDSTYNNKYKYFTDLRHARYIDDDLSDWTVKEVRLCKKAAKNFIASGEIDLTKWCREAAQKRLGLRDRQLLVAHFVDGG